PNGGIAQLVQLKSLVRSMEVLLRVARLAREMEDRTREQEPKSFMDAETIRRLLSETDESDEDFRDDPNPAENPTRQNATSYNYPSHREISPSSYQTFSPNPERRPP